VEEVDWTELGRAELEHERDGTLPRWPPKSALEPAVAKLVKRFAPAWKKGLPKCDAANRRLVERAIAWKPSAKWSPELAATILSVMSYATDEDVSPVCELVAREGFEFALVALVHLWSQNVDYTGNTEKSRSVWLTSPAPDHPHIMYASPSSIKSRFGAYLARVHRSAPKAECARMTKAARKLWKSAPRYAKAPIAVAVNDPELAAEIARELLANDRPHAFYAWEELAWVLTDAALVEQVLAKGHGELGYCVIANLGAAAFRLYERRITGSLDKHTRGRLLAQLSNLRGPRAAKIMAEYSDTKLFAPTVRAYFAAHPDLLEQMIRNPDLRYHRDDLEQFRAG
jgi:hypothetical protein